MALLPAEALTVGRILSSKDLEIVDLRGRINSLEIIGKRAEARVRDLEAALKKYGQHFDYNVGDPITCDWDRSGGKCTCGLQPILRGCADPK